MDFSVLMSVYIKEKPEYLKQAIDSVLNSSIQPTEILIIEDGKLTKELYDVLESYPVLRRIKLAKNMVRLSGYSANEIEIIETGIRPGEKLYEELLLDKERNEKQVFEKIFIGNIKGYPIDEVMEFVGNLSPDDKELAKEVVAYANASNK